MSPNFRKWFIIPFLLSALTLLTSKLLHPPTLTHHKIFVIGLSKTGTTSIGDALSQLGYRRSGWHDIRSRHLVHTWAHGSIEPHISFTQFYDAFEDLPWPMLYREMAELYPTAKFVLSLREDEEIWLRSAKRHFDRGQWGAYKYFYGANVFDGNEDVIRDSYRNHTKGVREYFEDKPGRMVELNIDQGDANWEVLCKVAVCPEDVVSLGGFPRSNTASSWSSNFIIDWFQWLWRWTVTRIEERAVDLYYRRGGNEGTKTILRGCWKCYDVVETMWMSAYLELIPGSVRHLRWVSQAIESR